MRSNEKPCKMPRQQCEAMKGNEKGLKTMKNNEKQ